MTLDQRKPPIRSPKMLKAANGQSCVHCGAHDGTVVACHYQGVGQGRLGKGKSQKPHDFAVADFCRRCHEHFDQYAQGNNLEASFDFLMAILLTQERRWRDGIIGDGREAA